MNPMREGEPLLQNGERPTCAWPPKSDAAPGSTSGKTIPDTLHVEPNAGNHLAWLNAILGLQRTLMAAERTAVTLIAFGFTVAQIFRNMEPDVPRALLDL